MRTAVLTIAGVFVSAVAAQAQTSGPRFYVAATTAVDAGERGNIRGGAVPSVGVLFGVRLTDAWSVEAELDRAFRRTSNTSEAFWVVYPPTPSVPREEFERYGIKARFDRTQKAGAGWSAHVMWRTRDAGRVNAGFFGGVTTRRYTTRVVRTTTFVSPLIDLPPTHPSILGGDESRELTGGGYTGGIAVFVRATGALTIVPEIRLTKGIITDDPYTVLRTGIRAAWDF